MVSMGVNHHVYLGNRGLYIYIYTTRSTRNCAGLPVLAAPGETRRQLGTWPKVGHVRVHDVAPWSDRDLPVPKWPMLPIKSFRSTAVESLAFVPPIAVGLKGTHGSSTRNSEPRRDQEQGGGAGLSQRVGQSFASPGEIKRREVELDP